MEIELRERKAFDVKIGETVLEEFVVKSEWEGFQKLKSKKHGEIIIVAPDGASKFSTYFENIFGGATVGFTHATVVRASSEIIALLKAADEVSK